MPAALIGRSPLLGALTGRLACSLERLGRDAGGLLLQLPQPLKLRAEAGRIAARFDEGAPASPPLQQRINALARLRRHDSHLSRRDWQLIAWGLCDDCGASGLPIEEQALFDAVMLHTESWLAARNVPRRAWFGLLNSYFSYEQRPAGERNWRRLRRTLVETLPVLTGSLRRPKLWSRMLDQHADVFTDDAGQSIHQALLVGTAEAVGELQAGLAIPEVSWLWREVVCRQISHVNALEDEAFFRKIPAMLALLVSRPLYADHILQALLTRYCQSGRRAETHEQLKDVSFTRWGNPQMRSATRWSTVDQAVHGMVLRWFAKDDLEHFFSLLQGDGKVDQARLQYWLRFVDQISYTRILLGGDAQINSETEFRNFRKKNAARCGQLVGDQGHNNAFIMRINDQYIVEFSGTGNACYFYAESELPFRPEARALHTRSDLRKQMRNDRNEVINKIDHRSRWQSNADIFLAERGIRPGQASPAATPKVRSYMPDFSPRAEAGQGEQVSPIPGAATHPPSPAAPIPTEKVITVASDGIAMRTTAAKTTVQSKVAAATELALANRVKVQDNLAKGGAFWVLSNDQHSALGRELVQIGMHYNPGKGYWIK